MPGSTTIRTIAALAAASALSVTGVATAAAAPRAMDTTTTTRPMTPATTVMQISAFPTGDKGSGTEATCALWSGRLNEDQGAIDGAEENNDVQQYKDALAQLEQDIDNALDAGCVVIY
jgi:phosphate-selective porin